MSPYKVVKLLVGWIRQGSTTAKGIYWHVFCLMLSSEVDIPKCNYI